MFRRHATRGPACLNLVTFFLFRGSTQETALDKTKPVHKWERTEKRQTKTKQQQKEKKDKKVNESETVESRTGKTFLVKVNHWQLYSDLLQT